jgi:Rho-binding antiterminator
MNSGIVIECIAIDTKLNENRVECIMVNLKEDASLIVLDEISKLEVCVDNPHFHTIYFN